MDYFCDIEKLQNSYLIIRKAGGWSTRDFGNLIGVSNQTICNIENKKTELTKTQYLATLAALEIELSKRSEDDLLSLVLGLIFENRDLTDDEKEKVLSFIDSVKKEKKLKDQEIKSSLAKTIGIASITGIVAGTIISVLFSKRK